jgi:hypothetical protein
VHAAASEEAASTTSIALPAADANTLWRGDVSQIESGQSSLSIFCIGATR